MRLVYLSPVPWSSFSQRPHKFVEWFHASSGDQIFWIDPYPTRFPLFSDFHRLGAQKGVKSHRIPPWLKIFCPKAVPIEPIPASWIVNRFLWRSILKSIEIFANQIPTMLVIGKPSVLSLAVLNRLGKATSVYDAMDDFPLFYSGLSRLAMRRREKVLIARVNHVIVSSTALKQRLRNIRPDIQLVPNGLDASLLPATCKGRLTRERRILGYVGTIGPWFDWEWVISLAKARPQDVVRLIGPIFSPSPYDFPENVEILPPCTHQDALRAMQNFDVGLIPFKKNDLTASVDPIKYYEYRALGLSVISTGFGEMEFRRDEEGTFISMGRQDINELVHEALTYRADEEAIFRFSANNSWESRFAAIKIMQQLS